jgi:DNA-binding NtrC family response regulator
MFIRSSNEDLSKDNTIAVLDRFKSQSASSITRLVRQAAQTDSCVIITGEINTGKRWTAQCIHYAGKHFEGPYYEVSCLALSNDRIRRELFGHISYTPEGIKISHRVFQKADGGTLLIDAFTLLPSEMQLHLVSIVERIGTQQVINNDGEIVEVQLILTLDSQEYKRVKEEPFWKGLVERLNPIFIHEPPLRERREDIPILVNLFLEQLCKKYQVPQPEVSMDAMHQIIKHDWPGNLRQLRNAVEHALILSDGSQIQKNHLPDFIQSSNHSSNSHHSNSNGAFLENHSLFTAERDLFREALQLYKNIEQAANRLGIKKKTIIHRLGSSSSHNDL